MKSCFPWFGGKSRASHIVWPRFGNTLNYIEPFAGSLAVLLKRPFPIRTETVNDLDAYIANFYRAVIADPASVAAYADSQVNEADLHARHRWLINQTDFREQMLSDPHYYDPKIAGWWVWGQSAWIGSGWCDVGSGKPRNGQPRPNLRPHQGVQGLSRQLPHLAGNSGAAGAGLHATAFDRKTGGIQEYMEALKLRLRRVRVTCGDWKRITGASVTYKIGVTAVFLDPPYGDTRQDNLYAVDSLTVADEVREWCKEIIEDGSFKGARYLHPKLRIALCGLDGEHNELEEMGWSVVAWKANGGYGNQGKTDNKNAGNERIWFSPHCLNPNPLSGIVDHTNYDDLFTNRKGES